jgi:imidazolonepropionase
MAKLAIYRDGALLVENGIVKAVGSRDSIERLITNHQVIDAAGGIVLPGFVDAHTHPIFGGNRSEEFEMRTQGLTYQEIAAAGGGIQSSVRATRAASEEELFQSARRRTNWFLEGGTTTIEAKSGYGLSLEDELKMLRVIRRLDHETPLKCKATFLGAHSFPPEVSRESYIRCLVEEMLPAVANAGLAEYCDIFCEQNYYSHDEARLILGRAKKLAFGLRMHVDQLSNNGGAELAAELGAVTADHLEQTDDVAIGSLKSAGVIPVLLPASVFALGLKKYPDARAMIGAGLPVVLATDFNPGSSPTPSIPMVLSLACTQMKMTPAEAITAATVNAAYSLGLNDRGTLEPGKRADFVIWDCEDYRELPYWLGVQLARRVYVEGAEIAIRETL